MKQLRDAIGKSDQENRATLESAVQAKEKAEEELRTGVCVCVTPPPLGHRPADGLVVVECLLVLAPFPQPKRVLVPWRRS